jgi:hypothetical protein
MDGLNSNGNREDSIGHNGVDSENSNSLIVELPANIQRIIEAAITLGEYESVDQFILQATTDKAEELQQNFRAAFQGKGKGSNSSGRGRPATGKKK